ncbi:unnamed protein product [Agarophyton chilense]
MLVYPTYGFVTPCPWPFPAQRPQPPLLYSNSILAPSLLQHQSEPPNCSMETDAIEETTEADSHPSTFDGYNKSHTFSCPTLSYRTEKIVPLLTLPISVKDKHEQYPSKSPPVFTSEDLGIMVSHPDNHLPHHALKPVNSLNTTRNNTAGGAWASPIHSIQDSAYDHSTYGTHRDEGVAMSMCDAHINSDTAGSSLDWFHTLPQNTPRDIELLFPHAPTVPVMSSSVSVRHSVASNGIVRVVLPNQMPSERSNVNARAVGGWHTAPCTPVVSVVRPPQHVAHNTPQCVRAVHAADAFSPVSPLLPGELREMIDHLEPDVVKTEIKKAVLRKAEQRKLILRDELKKENISDSARESRVSRFKKECISEGFEDVNSRLVDMLHEKIPVAGVSGGM